RLERRVRMDPGEEGLELARAPLDDVDEVELPGLGGLGALHPYERRDRVGHVGKQDVLVRRDEKEDQDRREQEHDDSAQHAPGCEESSQYRNRFRPPSTTRVCPVTYAARSEARKQTTSPNSRGVPQRPSPISSSCSSVGPPG